MTGTWIIKIKITRNIPKNDNCILLACGRRRQESHFRCQKKVTEKNLDERRRPDSHLDSKDEEVCLEMARRLYTGQVFF